MSDGPAPNRRMIGWMGAVVVVLTLVAGVMFFALSPRYLPEPPDRNPSEAAPEEVGAAPATVSA